MEEKYFIKSAGDLVEVTDVIYRAYYQSKEHEKYLYKKDLQNGLITLYGAELELCLNQASGGETNTPEKVFIESVEKKALLAALDLLTNEERFLVFTLFYECKSEAEVGMRFGIHQSTVNRRKRKVLEKLRLSLTELLK